MSSSSSEAEPFRDFLEESLEAVRATVPRAYRALSRSFGAQRVEVRVGGEHVALEGDGQRISASRGDGRERPTLCTEHRTLLGLIDGEAALLDTLEDGRVLLTGSPEELIIFHDALMAYLHGCVRAPDMPARLARYRRAVERGEDT